MLIMFCPAFTELSAGGGTHPPLRLDVFSNFPWYPLNMKQEHRFVADLYRYIAPFIDTAEPIFLSLDGEAAKKGVSEKHFGDAGIPDMWFTLVGATMPTLI